MAASSPSHRSLMSANAMPMMRVHNRILRWEAYKAFLQQEANRQLLQERRQQLRLLRQDNPVRAQLERCRSLVSHLLSRLKR